MLNNSAIRSNSIISGTMREGVLLSNKRRNKPKKGSIVHEYHSRRPSKANKEARKGQGDIKRRGDRVQEEEEEKEKDKERPKGDY